MQLQAIISTFRPSFLLLTPVCVFLGLSLSLVKTPDINWFIFILILFGALLAQISVDTLNEYYDFKSGLDLNTQKTPFSGGSGAIPNHPAIATTVLIIGIISAVLTSAIGLYFIINFGLLLLPIGIIGLLLVLTYTQWINRLPVLCLISPGLGFGILMVAGTFVVLTGDYSGLLWEVSLVPFFLVNNLLLLNQYPDMKADSAAGRKTFPIAFGITASNLVYFCFVVIAYALIIMAILMGSIPSIGWSAILPMLLSLFTLYGAVKYQSRLAQHSKYLISNIIATLTTPLLLGIVIFNA